MSEQSPVFAKDHRHPRPIRLWAANRINAPLNHADNDARQEEPGKGDTSKGQDNWHAALEFNDLVDLAAQPTTDSYELPEYVCGNWIFDCGPIDPFQLEALAILAHGAPGLLDVNAKAASAAAADAPELLSNPDFLSVNTLKSGKYDADLDRIGTRLHENSVVYLMGCRVAAGPAVSVITKTRCKSVEIAVCDQISTPSHA